MQIKQYLEQQKVDYQLLSHRPTFTAQQMAAEEHVPGQNVAKPVIVRADGKYLMCVIPACYKVDLDELKQQLKAKELQLASEEELAKLFPECELGAEPPFGNIYGIKTIIDKSLTQDKYLVFQAGSHEQALRVIYQDYEKLVQPQVLKFSYHLH